MLLKLRETDFQREANLETAPEKNFHYDQALRQ
jgi:hypothetical protein